MGSYVRNSKLSFWRFLAYFSSVVVLLFTTGHQIKTTIITGDYIHFIQILAPAYLTVHLYKTEVIYLKFDLLKSDLVGFLEECQRRYFDLNQSITSLYIVQIRTNNQKYVKHHVLPKNPLVHGRFFKSVLACI